MLLFDLEVLITAREEHAVSQGANSAASNCIHHSLGTVLALVEDDVKHHLWVGIRFDL